MFLLFLGETLFDDEGWMLADSNVPATRRQYTVRDLSPSASYQLRVAAWNEVGRGGWSTASVAVDIPQERK